MSSFGRQLLSEFLLDPDGVYLNHGTVGVAPRVVLAEQQRLRDEMERQPSRFLLREYSGLSGSSDRSISRVREAANQVAPFFGARGDDLVFVENATAGNMAVLHSLPLKAGDEILITNHEYGSTALIAGFVAQERGARVVTATLPYPKITPESAHDAIASRITDRTRVLVINHVTSETALRLPVKELAATCRARGIYVHVDGAHACGLLDLDIPSLGVQSYTSNLHKWAFAPKGSAILWVAPEHQLCMHPAVISWGLGKGFTSEFDWIGTRDVTPWLAAPAAIRYMREKEIERMHAYTYALGWQGANYLCQEFGTKMEVPREMCSAMLTIPLPARIEPTFESIAAIRKQLLYEHNIEAQMNPFEGRGWMRLSVQIYNEMEDFERLGRTLLQLIP